MCSNMKWLILLVAFFLFTLSCESTSNLNQSHTEYYDIVFESVNFLNKPSLGDSLEIEWKFHLREALDGCNYQPEGTKTGYFIEYGASCGSTNLSKVDTIIYTNEIHKTQTLRTKTAITNSGEYWIGVNILYGFTTPETSSNLPTSLCADERSTTLIIRIEENDYEVISNDVNAKI